MTHRHEQFVAHMSECTGSHEEMLSKKGPFKRRALEIASMLPNDPKEAYVVLGMAAEIVDMWWGGDPETNYIPPTPAEN